MSCEGVSLGDLGGIFGFSAKDGAIEKKSDTQSHKPT
jgi:hypothetical protein